MEQSQQLGSYDGANLCQDCKRFLLQPWEVDPAQSSVYSDHKANYAALRESARSGCGMCSILNENALANLSKRYQNVDIDTAISKNLANGYDAEEYRCVIHFQPVYDEPPYFRGIVDEFTYIVPIYPGRRLTDEERRSGKYSPVIQGFFSMRVALEAGSNTFIGGRPVAEYPDWSLCKKWVDNCLSRHTSCPGSDDRLMPTRVLDVDPGDGSLDPKLLITEGRRGQYCTLTHRWGDPEPPVTTSANLSERLNGIPHSELSPAFNDAINTVRELGYRYLWIDSLCILQDDREEWRRECPRMISVYTNSSLTIAGARSKDSWDGFLQPRNTFADTTSKLQLKSEDSSVDCILALSRTDNRQFRSFEYESALSERAWVLQERLLSPRVLYFGRHQMYFECNSSCSCEGLSCIGEKIKMANRKVPKDLLDLPATEMYKQWDFVVKEYSSRALKYGDDRLPALSGLAGFVNRRLADDMYCVGIWKSDIINGLLWLRQSSERRSEIPSSKALPSWSWAACDYVVTYQRLHLDITGSSFDLGPWHIRSARDFMSVSHLIVKDIRVNLSGDNPFGPVESGKLLLQGNLKPIQICEPARNNPDGIRETNTTGSTPLPLGYAIMDTPNANDKLEGPSDTIDATCLLISTGQQFVKGFGDFHPGHWLGVWVGLVVELVDFDDGEARYKRIGLAYGERSMESSDEDKVPSEIEHVASFFDDAEMTSITLV